MEVGQPGARSRRTGAQTRSQVQRVALDLFTRQGYEATSLRQIAEALGINKASLYYHFPSKEAILRSLVEERGDEADRLVSWLADQPRTPALLEAAVLRWVDSSTADKLRGIRFLGANPLLARTLADAGEDRIGGPLNRLVDDLVPLIPAPTAEKEVLLRMAILSINAAVAAAAHTALPEEAVVAAARTAAKALVGQLTAGQHA